MTHFSGASTCTGTRHHKAETSSRTYFKEGKGVRKNAQKMRKVLRAHQMSICLSSPGQLPTAAEEEEEEEEAVQGEQDVRGPGGVRGGGLLQGEGQEDVQGDTQAAEGDVRGLQGE